MHTYTYSLIAHVLSRLYVFTCNVHVQCVQYVRVFIMHISEGCNNVFGVVF